MDKTSFEQLSSKMRTVALGSYVFLLLLLAVQSIVEGTSVAGWIGRLLPLLIFAPGIWRGNIRSHLWLCFVCLLYFMVFVQDIFVGNTIWAVLSLIDIIVLFIAAMLFARWRKRT